MKILIEKDKNIKIFIYLFIIHFLHILNLHTFTYI